MEFRQLLQFIDIQDKNLNAKFPVDREKMILARTVKLSEELGELCDEVLAHSGLQRRQKLDELKKGNLEEEFADVIITALLLGKSMDIDIESAITKKMEKISKRD